MMVLIWSVISLPSLMLRYGRGDDTELMIIIWLLIASECDIQTGIECGVDIWDEDRRAGMMKSGGREEEVGGLV